MESDDRNGMVMSPPTNLNLTFDEVDTSQSQSSQVVNEFTSPIKSKKKRKGGRAQSIEEVFASISTVRTSGLNPPTEHIVLTPRSAEACLRCGVNPETLKIRDLESFYDPEITPAIQRMRHEAYSMRRHEEMKAVRQEKKNIIMENPGLESGIITTSSPVSKPISISTSSTPEKDTSTLTLLEIEKRRLDKVKRRQERELEQMLEFEMKMSKLQEQAAEKQERERRQAEQRERERMRQAHEMAEEKRQREIKKKAQADAEEERRRLVAAEMAAKDRELAEQKAKQDRLRKREARQREEERKIKAEEHRLEAEALLKQQQLEIQERLRQLEVAERTRNDIMEEQRQERAMQMDERRRKAQYRIQKNLKQARKNELRKKHEFQRKQAQSDQIRREHEAELSRQRELQRQEQELMERKRRMVLEEARLDEERRKELLLAKQSEMDQNIQTTQATQAYQLELKKEYRKIQQQLKLDKVERMKRIQEYKRLETLRKLQAMDGRTRTMLEQKEELVQRRKQIAIQTKIQRDLIMKTMESVKITKKWNQATKTIEQVISQTGNTSPVLSKSPHKERPKSSGAVGYTSLPSITRPHTPGSAKQQARVFRPPSPPPTRTAFKFTKEAQEGTKSNDVQSYFSPYDQVPEQLRPKNKKQPYVLINASDTSPSCTTMECDVVEVEVVAKDASISPSEHCLDELEKSAREEEQAQQIRYARPIESLLADFNHDGKIETNEITQMKENLHHFFDRDASGGIDSQEIQTSLSMNEVSEIPSAFQKLDQDHDSIISLDELDARWEAVGAEMTVAEVVDWVTYAVQLPQYASLFREHSISGYTFPLLMQDDGARLKEIGIDRPLHRQQLAMFVRRKYLGLGKKPEPVQSATCIREITTLKTGVVYITWKANTPLRFQLDRRSPGESTWHLVYTGSDMEYIDAVETTQHVMYRIATWNSYGRSAHTFIRCNQSPLDIEPKIESPPYSTNIPVSVSTPLPNTTEHVWSGYKMFKTYLWWLDEALVIAFFIILPIRGLIYGDADYILRVFRRLPPNMPTRVTVELDVSKVSLSQAAVIVSWEKPIDNGVPIVCYSVRITHLKTEEVQWIKLLTRPLPTSVSVEHLKHGETYKFVVEAMNAFGLTTVSSRSTYMVPVPELKGKQLLPQRSLTDSHVVRNQCYICVHGTTKPQLKTMIDRHILHFCSHCDREFCHHHKGQVHHSKALSCPAVNGRCICIQCHHK